MYKNGLDFNRKYHSTPAPVKAARAKASIMNARANLMEEARLAEKHAEDDQLRVETQKILNRTPGSTLRDAVDHLTKMHGE
jgi:Tfp pilus assembly protein PilE